MQKEKKTICEAGIVALAFNKNRTQCAFSPNNHQVFIYDTTAGGRADDALTWRHIHTLEGHQQSVSAIDWHHPTNRLLTVGHDRQAFVWVNTPFDATNSTLTATHVDKSASNEAWVPQMVELDAAVKRGLTCARWSQSEEGNKIYIGSAAKNVAVGTFNHDNAWWYGKVIECHASTVTTLAPHPTNHTIIATGSTDGTVALVSTYSRSVDGKGIVAEKFGTDLGRVRLPGAPWVNSISFSPSGDSIAVCSHDSRIHILSLADSGAEGGKKDLKIAETIRLKTLPMRAIQWISETAVVAAGYDFFPILVQYDKALDKFVVKGKWTAERPSKTGAPVVQSQASLARMQFQNESRMGQKAAVELVNSRHKSTINSVWPITQTWDGDLSEGTRPIFVTSGMDGLIEFWKPDEMSPESS